MGSTTGVIRTKDRGTAETQIVGLDIGIGDSTELLMGAANPMPVNIASSGGNIVPTTQALTAVGASTLAGTGSTTGSAVINVATAGNASFHLLATAFVGTVVFEQSFDPTGANGTWAPVPCIPEDALSPAMSTLAINTAVAYVRQFTQGMFGPALFRVRVTAFTSGTLTAYLKAGPGWVEGQPALAPSAASIGNVTLNGSTVVAPVGGTAAAQTPPGAGGTGVVCITTAAIVTATSLIAAPAAGLSIYVTDISLSNSGATATLVSLFEGTTSLRLAQFLPASGAGGGFTSNLRTPWKLPAATAVGYANSAASTSVYITVGYFVAA